jgi:lysozyme
MTRRINAAGLNLVKTFEGVRLTAYRCPAGVWTIGYGHTGPDVKPGQRITEAEAEALLRGDLDRFECGVTKAIGDVQTTDNQFSAMVSLAFNIGMGDPKQGVSGFLLSTVLRQHRAGNTQRAAAAFLLWVKANGRTLKGLIRRRSAERTLYLEVTQ